MRTLWSAISIVCFLNVVALLGLIGWLAQKGSLTPERLADVRTALFESEEDRTARLDAEAQALEAAKQAESADGQGPNVQSVTANDLAGSEVRVQQRLRQSDADMQRVRRLEREIADLRSALTRERGVIDQEREAFERDKKAFNDMRDRIESIEGAEQFEKSLIVYESIKPAQAMEGMLELVRSGETEQAVSYLDAMEPRKRSKVIAELIKSGETPLATDLLEAIRTRGIEPMDMVEATP